MKQMEELSHILRLGAHKAESKKWKILTEEKSRRSKLFLGALGGLIIFLSGFLPWMDYTTTTWAGDDLITSHTYFAPFEILESTDWVAIIRNIVSILIRNPLSLILLIFAIPILIFFMVPILTATALLFEIFKPKRKLPDKLFIIMAITPPILIVELALAAGMLPAKGVASSSLQPLPGAYLALAGSVLLIVARAMEGPRDSYTT